MEYFLLIIFTLLLLVAITRPFTVLFHELGHAIPAILLTKEKVTVYIGSYGNPANSLKLNIGLLEIWFRYNPFSWQLCVCIPNAKEISINRQIIYTLAGPFASFLIATIACYFTFSYDLHGAIKLILIIFLGSSIFDLIINLIPQERPIKLYDGTLTYNDGYSLKQLFFLKKLPKEYLYATDLYNKEEYTKAALLYKTMLINGLKNEAIYRLAISSYLQIKDFNEAKKLLDTFISFNKMTSDDFSNAGLTYSHLGLYEKALEFYDKSLQENPCNKYSLNNKGYTLNLLTRYKEAIPYFDKAIEIETTFAHSYNNRGLAKIKIGEVEEGLADINHSFEFDKDNSYGYMNLGIYHFDKGEYSEALTLFKKAKELDYSTHMIDDMIAKALEYQSKKN